MKTERVIFVERRSAEIFAVNRWPNGFYVTAQDTARELRGDEQALAAGGIDRVIHRVVLKLRSNLAGPDSIQRIRPRNALERQIVKILGRRVAQRLDV